MHEAARAASGEAFRKLRLPRPPRRAPRRAALSRDRAATADELYPSDSARRMTACGSSATRDMEAADQSAAQERLLAAERSFGEMCASGEAELERLGTEVRRRRPGSVTAERP